MQKVKCFSEEREGRGAHSLRSLDPLRSDSHTPNLVVSTFTPTPIVEATVTERR